MIERHWIGVARADAASAYVAHLETETFPGLERLPGFREARILRRDTIEGVELITCSYDPRGRPAGGAG